MSKVVLIRCESYEHEAVKNAVKRGVDLLGGPSQFARPTEKILLKPNWLVPDPPEKITTTNPAVFRAVVEVFLTTGAKLSYGDSPAIHSHETASQKTGYAKIADDLGVTLADFKNGREIFFKDGVQNKKFIIAAGALDADGIISLPKLKTHGFERLTGCIKNQFGCIPGALKGEFHVKVPDAVHFAQMLVDLNAFLKPRLYVMDGIIAMEGNGPRGGKPCPMNVLIFSADPVAIDATVCRLINIDPEFVPTTVQGMRSKMGTHLEKEIEYAGDPFDSFVHPAFAIKREPVRTYAPGAGMSFLKNSIVPKPYIMFEKCIKCGICVGACPVEPKALFWADSARNLPPQYKYERCIRCYCCQELCPEGAILLRAPLIRRIFRIIRHKRQS